MEMSGNLKYQKQLTFSEITVQITELGEDYHIMLRGGDKPHIGCTVLAVPRPSLTGDGSISVTSSVLNVTGTRMSSSAVIWRRKLPEKKNGQSWSARADFTMITYLLRRYRKYLRQSEKSAKISYDF